MKDTVLIPIILSGGSGTRLWPLSRAEYPKQFLSLTSYNTMIQDTVLRLQSIYSKSPIVVCNEQHRFIVAEQLSQINVKESAIILEPFAKNTAPAIAVACFHALTQAEDAIVVVLASDHVIKNQDSFLNSLVDAIQAAKKDNLVTFGIKPTEANTGYGYIKANVNKDSPYFPLDKFVEKPNLQKAQEYLADGSYFWNSGMFIFKAKVFLEELKKYDEQIYKCSYNSYKKSLKDLDFIRLNSDEFYKCPSNSIDYAVMEKTTKGVVVPLDCGWSDVGSWSALWQVNDKDESGNVCFGDVITKNTSNSFIYSQNRLVTTLGIKDTIVVETRDTILVANKDAAQEVKQIVDTLKEQNRTVATENRVGFRPWGTYDSIEKGQRYKVKHITVKPGAKLSVQMHYHRAEHWIVVSGTAKVLNGQKELILAENESTFIPLGTIHALENPGKVPLELIEVQSGSYLEEDDIVRFEDKYGRC